MVSFVLFVYGIVVWRDGVRAWCYHNAVPGSTMHPCFLQLTYPWSNSEIVTKEVSNSRCFVNNLVDLTVIDPLGASPRVVEKSVYTNTE